MPDSLSTTSAEQTSSTFGAEVAETHTIEAVKVRTEGVAELSFQKEQAAPAQVRRPVVYSAPTSYTPAGEAPMSLNTSLFDSIAADTVSGRVPHFLPRAVADSLNSEALVDSLASARLPAILRGKEEGIDGTSMPAPYIGSTPLGIVMVGALILGGFNADSMARGFSAYRAELWSVRRRPNMFDREQSVPFIASLIYALIFIVFSGIVLYNVSGRPEHPSFGGAALSMGVMALYYVLQIIVYSLVGFTFTSDSGRRRFLGGFKATQAFAGLALIVPAIMLIICPEWYNMLIIIALCVYMLARLIFISKGIRIFYDGFASLLYFILYLCTLEILPAAFLYQLSSLISEMSL